MYTIRKNKYGEVIMTSEKQVGNGVGERGDYIYYRGFKYIGNVYLKYKANMENVKIQQRWLVSIRVLILFCILFHLFDL